MNHPTKEQTEKTRLMVQKKPGLPLSIMAEKLEMSEAAVVEALPEEMRIRAPVEDFEKIWNELRTWEKATFIVSNRGAIIEMSGRLPKGSFGQGYFNLDAKTGMMGGHLKIDSLGSIWLVSKPFFYLESHSLHFYAADGSSAFSVYAGRDDDRNLLIDVVCAYKELWAKYGLQQEVSGS